jgi:BMFP domain-containing protein YqiC
MQTDSRLFDDLARVASGAVGVLAGVRTEVEQIVRAQMERVLAKLDLVSREEFEVVRAMAAKAREENALLAARLSALEQQAAPETAIDETTADHTLADELSADEPNG